jgi:DNA-binding PadR family transcriptional regulator
MAGESGKLPLAISRPHRYPYKITEVDIVWSGPASLYVLIALADGPAHGLGIAENVADFTDDKVVLGPGTLYRVLKDLDEEGLIRRVPSPADENPHRKYYELTPGGREQLRDAYEELAAVTRAAQARLGIPLPREA